MKWRWETNLYGSQLGRKAQPHVIPVSHDDATNHPGAHAPAGLVHVLQVTRFALKLGAKRLCKVLPKVVACAGLQQISAPPLRDTP